MNDTADRRWDVARGEVIRRWRKILDRVAERDEGGALALANVMDEFCDEAQATREATEKRRAGVPATRAPSLPGASAGRCLFCRGFTEMGGCFGLLDQFNRAVMARRWELARHLVERYIERLQSADLANPEERRVH